MNTKTNTLWCKSLAMLALTFALAGTALGQITIQWPTPADITYGTPLDGTQLNARAVDAGGNNVPGTFKYSWDAPTPPANAGDGEDDPATDGVKIGQRELTLADILAADADNNDTNGLQIPDWRFLDAGANQTLRVVFTPDNLVQPFPKTVQIKVNPKQVTVFPRALERDYGEENYPGWETGKTPTYTNGNNLFDGNGQLQAGVASNLLKADGTNATRGPGGQNIQITGTDPDSGNGYAFTGDALFFDGFVRGETYQKLAGQDIDVAAPGEVLVTTLPRLAVKDGNGNDIFRGAPVGTSGTVTFETNPGFKNYSVSIGGSGSLTVKKASITFTGAERKDGNAKTFGDTLVLDQTNAFKNPDFSLNNDFRLGEEEILNFISISSGATSATANVGTYPIVLTETPPQTFDVSILRNNYNFTLNPGSQVVKKRDITLTAVPSDPPGGFDPANTSGFNFKLYGDSAQAPTFTVTGLAPHHVKNPGNTYKGQNDTYLPGDIEGAAFDTLPTVAHTVSIESVPGTYPISISGGAGQGGNYNITARNAGQFEVRRAYLVIQVGNASSIINQGQATAPISLFGVRTFDQVLNGDGSLNVNATLDRILVPGTPKPTTGVVGAFNANPGGPYPRHFPIEFKNTTQVRATNYDVYFNDGTGSRNFLDNGTPVAIKSDGSAPSDPQTGFNNFLANVFDVNKDPAGFTGVGGKDGNGVLLSHALFVANSTTIGRYTIDVVRPKVNWNPPSTIAFGTDTKDSDLNAVILNADTGLVLDDNRNVPQLIRGTDYFQWYTIQADGGAEITIKADAAGANGNPAVTVVQANPLQLQRMFPAGKTHKLRLKMQLLGPGLQKVTNAGRVAEQFTASTTVKNFTVVARQITVTPRETGKDPGKADLIFGNAIPSRNFADAFWDATYDGKGNLTDAQLLAEIKFDDVKVDVLNSAGAAIAPGNTSTARGDYPIQISGLAAKNGNVSFATVNGVLSVTPIPVVIEWENNLPSIVYGQAVPVAGVKDAVIKTAGASAEGSIVYTPDPEAVSILPNVPGQAIKAKWVPNNPATSNFGESNEITRTVGVSKKAITVEVAPIDKTFGDNTPSPSLVTPIEQLLAPQDLTRVSVNFTIAGSGSSNKAAVGEYVTTPTFVDAGNRLANYAVTIINSRVKVNKRAVTVTPVSRSMEVGQNATDFVDNWKGNAGVKANAIVTFSGLASFHTIGDNRGKLDAAFPALELGTDSPSLPPVGTTANIRIDNLGFTPGNMIDGAAFDNSNYNFTEQDNVATLSVVEKAVVINWADVNITYGQKIGRSGKNPGDNGGTNLNDIKALNATAANASIVYTFVDNVTITRPTPQSFAAGSVVPDGIILPAGEHKIRATATPNEGQTEFATSSKVQKVIVAKRPLTITIKDRTNTYGDLDLFFQADYGIKDGNGNLTTDRLVNGDTPSKLNRQLVLFSNANATSGAGEYYIAVGQSASDPNYAINQVAGTQQLFDGRVTDANGVVLVNVGTNTDGTGQPFGFTRSSTGAFETRAGKFTVEKAPLTIGAADLSKDQGQPNPPIQAIIPDETQLKNGDTLETLLATPVRFSTSVGVNTAPGSYDIFAFGGSSANYVVTHVDGTFTVLARPAPIGWNPNPSSIVYGTALGADQLNATSTVAGTFDYSANPAGTVLGAGVQSLSTTFTPTDLAANRVTTVTATIEVTPAPLTVTANDITRAFSAPNPDFTVGFSGFVNGDGPAVITSPITFATDGVAGANAGAYPLTPSGGAAANYDITFVPGTINITKENATITLADLNQVADGTPRMVSVTTVPEGVSVGVTYNGRANAPTESGTYEIRAIANDPNYNGFAIGTLTVSGTGVVTISNLTRTFTGSGLGATITTDPVGLGTQVTYNGSPNLPVNAGTYEVRVIIDDPVFSGFGVDVLTIQPAEAQITFDLDSLNQPVNALTGAVVNTVPAGLNTEIFYGDSTTIPNEIGSTLVRGVINEPNWVGSVTSTFRVENATQTISVPEFPEFEIEGDPLRIALFGTASSGLPVTFSVVSGGATVRNRTLTVTQPGSVVVRASQAGNDFWASAETTFTVTVTGQGVPQAAPSLRVAGISNAGIEIAVTGAAGATVNIMGTDILPGGTFSSVGTVTLNGSGNGSLTVPVSG